jgi:hypothetical protein
VIAQDYFKARDLGGQCFIVEAEPDDAGVR